MSLLASQIESSKLYGLFDILSEHKRVSKEEVIKLKSMVLEVANVVHPHLKNIPSTFEQYTIHDDQHLLNIADNVFSLIANNDTGTFINEVELWFLWMAILLHDVGMHVDRREKQELLDSQEYKDYQVRCLHQMKKAATLRGEGKSVFAQCIEDAIFAEFVRRKHAQRVHKYISTNLHDPIESKSLVFFYGDHASQIGRLCESHSWGVSESNDPFEPANCVKGLGSVLVGKTRVELAFLGCLLRLGDVLDFDRTRTPMSAFHSIYFSEHVSEQEWKKHLSVDGISISSKNVEYQATCETIHDFLSVQKFLDLVDSEIQNCVELTRATYPAGSNYRLSLFPMVQRNRIRLKDENTIAEPIKFSLDYERIVGLLMEESLYPSKTLFLRELLQNSADACRLQKALAEEHDMGEKYNPKITITYHPETDSDPKSLPKIVFQDNGVGISIYQLRHYLVNVGQSYYKSNEFQTIQKRLGMKGLDVGASSRFGIGFLSCFLASSRIEIESFNWECTPLRIEINGPKEYLVVSRVHCEKNDIRFQTPKDPEDDSPPSIPGTKITMHLNHGWNETLKTGSRGIRDFVNKTAVNLDIPIEVQEIGKSNSKLIKPNRYLNDAIPHKSWMLDSLNKFESSLLGESLVEQKFPLQQIHDDLNGYLSLLFLKKDEQIFPCLGDVNVFHSLRESSYLNAVREFCIMYSHQSNAAKKALKSTLRRITEENERREHELKDNLKCLSGHDRNRILFNDLFLEDLSWVSELIESNTTLHTKTEHWGQIDNEFQAMLLKDRPALMACWRENGISKGGELALVEGYEIAIQGIKIPGNFQSWNFEKANIEKLELGMGLGRLRIDAKGNLAPRPAANRLFIPISESRRIHCLVLNAYFQFGKKLWKDGKRNESWSIWFSSLLRCLDEHIRCSFYIASNRNRNDALNQYASIATDIFSMDELWELHHTAKNKQNVVCRESAKLIAGLHGKFRWCNLIHNTQPKGVVTSETLERLRHTQQYGSSDLSDFYKFYDLDESKPLPF